MTKRVIIITGNSLRHDYVRKAFGLAEEIDVLKTYRETKSGNYLEDARKNDEQVRVKHLKSRLRSEHDFFEPFVNITKDYSNPVDIPFGSINNKEYHNEITTLDPDLLVVYGSSLIKNPLLNEFEDRILNVHLGLSPYYRGAGTNFWALVNSDPEYVGATFMYIDEGVDTGEIIHQLRARVHPNDSPHDIGNRLISDVGQIYPELVRQFDSLGSVEQLPEPDNEHYYQRSDYNPKATQKLYENFEKGMIEKYLEQYDERTAEVPIIKHPEIEEERLLLDGDI